MFSKKKFLISLIGLGLFLGVASGVTAAEVSAHLSTQTNQFRQIGQPLSLRIIVTLGGLALIGLELWWFLLSKTKARKVESQ